MCFEERKATKGTPQIYGEDWYVREASGNWECRQKEKTTVTYQRSIYEKEADEQLEILFQTKKDRELRIEVRRWEDMLMHSSDGNSMKKAVFDLVRTISLFQNVA